MKALSLTQPWASLCVAPDPTAPWRAVKPIETRSWRVTQKHLPMRLAIHASLGITREMRLWITDRTRGSLRSHFVGWYGEALELAGLSRADPWHSTAPGDKIPLGAIIGSVTLVGCVPSDEVADGWKRGAVTDLTYHLGDFSPGRWGWIFTRPVPLARPIPCRGKQGLWTVPGPIAVDIWQGRDETVPA